VAGPFLSSDLGQTWTRASAGKHRHDDQESIYFDPAVTTGQRFFLTSDGGVVMTPDFGGTFVSHYNQNLANLQFLDYSAVHEWYGSISVRSLSNPSSDGLNLVVAGGTQDNATIYAASSQSLAPWQLLPDVGNVDGGLALFLQNGDLLHYDSGKGNDTNVRRVHWDTTGGSFSSLGDVPVQPPPSSGPNAVPGAVMATVTNPTWRNAAGQLLYAIGGSGSGIYGIFAGDDFSGMHWEPLGTLALGAGEYTTAVGSYDGSRVYAGTVFGKLYQVSTSGGQITPVPLQLPNWPVDNSINHILTPSAQARFLTLNSFSLGIGTLYRTLDGTTWVNLASGFPNSRIYGMAVDTASSPRTLYVASQANVSVSQTDGDTWSDLSSGLPRNPTCTDLRVFTDSFDNSRWLYLGTFGRSIWRTQLAGPRQIIWVDFNYPSDSTQLGTFDSPYSTLAQGTTAVPPRGTIAIKPGSSRVMPTISKQMTITAVGGPATIGR
jgi:hypothetical protein